MTLFIRYIWWETEKLQRTYIFLWSGFYNAAKDYYTHKRRHYIDLRDDLEVVRDKNGTYGPDLLADRIERIVAEHDKTKVRDTSKIQNNNMFKIAFSVIVKKFILNSKQYHVQNCL